MAILSLERADAREDLCTLASKSAVAIGEELGDGRLGGVLRVFNAATGRQMINIVIGSPNPEKLKTYEHFSWEKAQRLLKHPHTRLSWETRNEAAGQYPGASRSRSGYIITISGYPALVDESYGVVLFQHSGVVDSVEVGELTAISNNPHYERVHEIVSRYC